MPAVAFGDPGTGQAAPPKVSWNSCADSLGDNADLTTAVVAELISAQCTRVPVPIDYANPSGPQAELAVIRIPAIGKRLGSLFVNPGEKVYVGMILGENSRDNDLDVNPIKEKKLTNIRAAGKDEALLLIPPRKMSLEQAIAYIEDDELVEVTPSAVRLRKRYLDPHERKKHARRTESEAA